MPSQLPTTDTLSQRVHNFGVGTYDSGVSSPDNDEGDSEVRRESLPAVKDLRDTGEEMNGYGYCPKLDPRIAEAVLPGDLDRPPSCRKKPESSVIMTPLDTVAQSKLPSDEHNPSARSDWYDKTKMGHTSLPGPPDNEETLDNFLGALGNMWSGWELENVAQPLSFPTMDRPPEEVDKFTSVPVGASTMKKFSTDLSLVGTIAEEFLKKNGKKGLTRRHVMAFLQQEGYHQYLASDVVRCLQQRHGVDIVDVLDMFPVKVAAIKDLTNLGNLVLRVSSKDKVVSSTLGKCGQSILRDVAELVRSLNDG